MAAGRVEPLFSLYEVVTVRDTEKTRRQGTAGREGAVLGIAVNEETGWVGYAVQLYDDLDEGWDFTEDDLLPTGRMDTRETFYDGSSMRVSGEGQILGEQILGEDDGDAANGTT